MSYDISLTIDTGKGEAEVYEVGNYTYNVYPMFRHALVLPDGINSLHDANAGESIDVIRRAVLDMEAYPEVYKPMNPANGWGSYEGALAYLYALLAGCEQHPKCTIRVS